ncbi:MAG: type IV pilus assembly protein PilM [Kiritimatiellia bacterium]
MAKKFLTLNIGASAIALAEYEANGDAVTLVNYGTAALAASLDTGSAATILAPALMEIVREKGIRPGKVAIAVSGQMVFPRFAAVAVAGNDEAKFEQAIRFEIEQNIPFPIDEMVCDRQVLGDTGNGEKSVMIVAAKTEQIEAITDAVQASGFQPTLVDVAPLAVTNALKACRPADEGCVVILAIGAKTTSLVITEGDKLYNRSIPVAGNTLTKEIAQALGCTLDEAEEIKRENAYVSMGGVTEDEDATLDRISKVCRAVLTRLHAEISRSINFYRSQQGGGVPVKLYLTGGSALLPQIDAFFRDSLQIDVEFFNPFDTLGVGPSVDAEALATDAAFLSETAGLALHEAGRAALAINLLPRSLVEARAEAARIPFVAVGAFALALGAVCLWRAAAAGRDQAAEELARIESRTQNLKTFETKIKAAQAAEAAAQAEADGLKPVLAGRSRAVDRFNAVRLTLGNYLWIQGWQNGRITIRGWKDRIATYVETFPAGEDGKRLTAPEIVEKRLKGTGLSEEVLAKWPIDPSSVKVTDMTSFGKEGCVEQFVVELKFK